MVDGWSKILCEVSGRLRIDKALGNFLKSDNKTNRNNVRSARGPLSGSEKLQKLLLQPVVLGLALDLDLVS